MHILFSVRNAAYVRHYEPVLRELAARGHRIDLIDDGGTKSRAWPAVVEQLARDCPNLQLGSAPVVTGDRWYELATAVRQNLFHARFLEPMYADTPVLRSRAAAKAPAFARGLIEGRLGRIPAFRRVVTRALRWIERSTPVPEPLLAFLRRVRPDVVVVTPLVVLRTAQPDLVRAARSLGIPTVFAVASWDHLSSKGLIFDVAERLIVWNETQAEEAVALHDVPRERVVVTGAQVFDAWFARGPARDRATFCARVGLDPARPYVLYVGSALFEGSPSEAEFAARWIETIRQQPGLSECGVLVRPHFKRGEEWGPLSATALPGVTIWPPRGEVPVDADSRDAYFDSLFHAAAIVGLNTSALIEGAILGKPVLTVLTPPFHGNQEGTLHFRYLTQGTPPLLHTSTTLDDHARLLARIVGGADPDPGRSERFVGHFVRPGHAATPAAALVAGAIEAAAALPIDAQARTTIPRLLLAPLADAAVRRVSRIREELRRIDDERRDRKLAQKAAARRAGH